MFTVHKHKILKKCLLPGSGFIFFRADLNPQQDLHKNEIDLRHCSYIFANKDKILFRNWGFHWNEGGSSNDPCAETYMGKSWIKYSAIR